MRAKATPIFVRRRGVLDVGSANPQLLALVLAISRSLREI
jgi:hypothetical protein